MVCRKLPFSEEFVEYCSGKEYCPHELGKEVAAGAVVVVAPYVYFFDTYIRLNLLDWMAKKRMNAFQLQFRHSGVFWRRGYGGIELAAQGQASTLSEEDCLGLDDRVIARVAELGMTLHRVGHGWTTYTLGLSGLNWERSRRQP